jgi:hypothetical protein
MARIGNYEIYQKILEQVTSIKLGSAENLIADFYKRIMLTMEIQSQC